MVRHVAERSYYRQPTDCFAMLLSRSTWRDVESHLARSRGLVIPIGSTEQHGPTGLIGTDAFTAEAVARGMQKHPDILVGPTLSLGVAQFNLGFPGTVSLRASTLMAVIEDYVLSLARQGFSHFYFVNGHGANIAAARAAFQDIYARWSLGERAGPAPRCRLRSWWEYPAADRLRRALYGEREGMHATPSEIALTMHLFPEWEHGTDAPAPAPISAAFLRDHAGDNHWDAASHRAAFPDGRVGSDSGLANAKDGAQLLEAAIGDAIDDYQAFLAEP
ncbi:MAG: creatininase family protein [Burkholderiales bacterium]